MKQLCKLANVEKIDAGPKGLAIAFKDNHFARPDQLIAWIAGKNGRVQLRADHKLIVKQTLPAPDLRSPLCTELLQELVALLV
jgi:transcription-repair coupling factor (superfamily II helicase)